ncbi:ribosomal-processing cysteine protease Prp [Mogibacterium diversum]
MIHVKVNNYSVEVNGHAGYMPHGSDIVCAGVSALYQTLEQSAKELTDSDYKTSSEAGYGRICPIGEVSNEYKLLVSSFLIGVNGIASSYPDYVKVITN